MQQIINDNITSREQAAAQAETLIDQAIHEFGQVGKSLEAVNTLVRFRRKHDDIKNIELKKALDRLEKGDDPQKLLKTLANQLTNKIIHTPSVQIKQAKVDGRDDILEAIEEIFQLEEDQEDAQE